MTTERAIDAMAAEYAQRRSMRPLRVFTDLEHERAERATETDWRTRQLSTEDNPR